jgi:hypothetical protein
LIGGTAQTVVPKLNDTVVRLEYFYNFNEPYNVGTNGESSGIYDWVRRGCFGMGLNLSNKFRIPWWTKLCDDKMMDISLTYFYERVFNWKDDIIIAESGRGHRARTSSAQEIAYNVQQFMVHQTVMLMVTGSYNPIGKWFVAPILAYVPGNHWRWELGFPTYGSSERTNKGLHDKDSVLFRMRYEF